MVTCKRLKGLLKGLPTHCIGCAASLANHVPQTQQSHKSLRHNANRKLTSVRLPVQNMVATKPVWSKIDQSGCMDERGRRPAQGTVMGLVGLRPGDGKTTKAIGKVG